MERQRPPGPEHNAGYRAQDIEQEKGGKGGERGKRQMDLPRGSRLWRLSPDQRTISEPFYER